MWQMSCPINAAQHKRSTWAIKNYLVSWWPKGNNLNPAAANNNFSLTAQEINGKSLVEVMRVTGVRKVTKVARSTRVTKVTTSTRVPEVKKIGPLLPSMLSLLPSQWSLLTLEVPVNFQCQCTESFFFSRAGVAAPFSARVSLDCFLLVGKASKSAWIEKWSRAASHRLSQALRTCAKAMNCGPQGGTQQ